jgi:hypothetical protein
MAASIDRGRQLSGKAIKLRENARRNRLQVISFLSRLSIHPHCGQVVPSIWVKRVIGSEPVPYPGSGELHVAVPWLQSVKVNARLPHEVCFRSPDLKLGGNFAPVSSTAGKVTLLLVAS